MQFTVTYRNANGAMITEAVEAASRGECIAQMKSRGITPTRVKEGGSAPRKSAERKTVPAKSQGTKTSHQNIGSYVLFAVLVLLVAGGLWWWLGREKAQPTPEIETTKKSSLAKEVKPAAAPKPVVTNAVPLTEEEKRKQRLKQIRDKYGENIPDNLKAVVYFLEHPPQRKFKAQGTHQFFRHPSERQIAGVVLTEPGTFFVMKPEFGDAFDRDFANALVDKIEINDDDTDAVRDAKEAMKSIKKEIAELCGKEGKKPSEVMNEQAAAMYELGRYQRNLEEELDKIHANPDLSDKDVEDFCKAANELLASKGLPQMPLPNLARRSIQLKHAQRRAERKAAREAEKEKKK